MATRAWRQDSSRLHQGGSCSWLQRITHPIKHIAVLPRAHGLRRWTMRNGFNALSTGHSFPLAGVETASSLATPHVYYRRICG